MVLYRASLVFANLGWVALILVIPPIVQLGKMMEHPDKSQPNQGP